MTTLSASSASSSPARRQPAGPLLVVYPDGNWHHYVDEAFAQRIADEHLIGGKPVEEAIFHRLGA